jgi:OTU domain-containing protein 5
MYNRPVELYCYDLTPINIYNSEQINNGYQPLRLSYHRYSHYNAILDPYKSSVGVGLGLAGYRPEDFDPAKQVTDACQMSEQLEIEKMMVEDKLKTTDWEATSEIVVEQIARQSYLQFCKENMNKKADGNKSSTSTVTSTEIGSCSSSSSNMTSCNAMSVAGQQTQSCSSNQCDSEKKASPFLMEYFGSGKKSKKRHHHHHHM